MLYKLKIYRNIINISQYHIGTQINLHQLKDKKLKFNERKSNNSMIIEKQMNNKNRKINKDVKKNPFRETDKAILKQFNRFNFQ